MVSSHFEASEAEDFSADVRVCASILAQRNDLVRAWFFGLVLYTKS
jgi:hypothetical protein